MNLNATNCNNSTQSKHSGGGGGLAEPQQPTLNTGDGGSGRGEAHTVGNYHSELDLAGR